DEESARSPVDYRVKRLPVVPTITGIDVICAYDANPTFTATGEGETMRWYTDADVWKQDGADLEHDLTDGRTGNITYKASQVLEGCEGNKQIKTFRVVPKPTAPRLTGRTMCEGETTPALLSDVSQTEWYGDSGLTDYLGAGFSFKPLGSPTEDQMYYAVVRSGDCQSDVSSATL